MILPEPEIMGTEAEVVDPNPAEIVDSKPEIVAEAAKPEIVDSIYVLFRARISPMANR
jgi:hypothetical protein